MMRIKVDKAEAKTLDSCLRSEAGWIIETLEKAEKG